MISQFHTLFADTEPMYRGPVRLPSGREVYDTGKVRIGILHSRRQTAHRISEDIIQAAMLKPTYLSNSLRARFVRWLRAIILNRRSPL